MYTKPLLKVRVITANPDAVEYYKWFNTYLNYITDIKFNYSNYRCMMFVYII